MLRLTPRAALARLVAPLALTILTLLSVLSPTASAAGGQQMGVQAHVLWSNVDRPEMDRQLDQAKRAGATYIRADFGWQTLETNGKGQYETWYLNKLDNLVQDAQARGLKLLVTVLYTPCWASSAPDSLKQNCSDGWWDRGVSLYPPTNARDYGDVMAYLADRYKGRVAAWEIWNEPNLSGFWTANDPAGSYVDLVKGAYPRIKAADPSTTVVAGALSESDVDFARELYAKGIKGFFDVFSVHPYSHDRSPLDPLEPRYVRSSFIMGVPAVHEVMTSNGDPRPMWLTEFGWSTTTVRGGAPWENGVDESTQALYLRQAFTQMRKWSYVKVGISYALVDRSADRGDLQSNFGLLRYDRTPKPAYGAFQAMAAALAQDQSASPTQPAPSTNPPSAPSSGSTPLAMRVDRKGDGVVVWGLGRARAQIKVTVYGYQARLHRFAPKAGIVRKLQSDQAGFWAVTLHNRALKRGIWRFDARDRRTRAHASAFRLPARPLNAYVTATSRAR